MSRTKTQLEQSRRWRSMHWAKLRVLTRPAAVTVFVVTAAAAQSSAAMQVRESSNEPTAIPEQGDTAPAQSTAAQGPAERMIPVLALGVGFLGCVLGGVSYVLLRGLVRELDKHQRAFANTQVVLNRVQAVVPSRVATMTSRPEHEVLELRDRLHHLEHLVAKLQDQARPGSAPAVGGSTSRVDVAGHDVGPTDSFVTAPTPAPDTGVDILPGALSDESVVKLSTSSKPMVEIRWQDGAATAEVYVNPEYKFADLNATYLESAFDVDVMGPGSFETVSPAVVDWTRAASSGRVMQRGRVRALGSA